MAIVAAQTERATAEAAAWLARLQGAELSEQDGVAFDAWLAAGPENEVAYREALGVWHAYEAAAEEVVGRLVEGQRQTVRRSVVSRRWMFGAGGIAAAAGVAAVVLPGLLAQPTVAVYVTGKGERKRITLADNSTIDLNAETRLEVRYSRGAREIRLGDGEAIFDVTHDPKRPFTVAAANRVVQVVGTQFDVRNRTGDLTVTVARGKVQVRPSAGGPGRILFLTPGQRLEVDPAGLEQLKVVDPQETFSWRAGRLVYRGEPLASVVSDLNRQFVAQVEIEDPELAKMPITGVLVLDDQAAVMARLSLMLPVRSVPSDRGLLLLRK